MAKGLMGRKRGYFVVLVFCGIAALSCMSQGEAFVDDFDANSPTDPNMPLVGYELGLIFSGVSRVGGGGGIVGIQNGVAYDGNSSLILDANNTLEDTCLLSKDYMRSPLSDVGLTIGMPIIDEYTTSGTTAGWKHLGIVVSDKMLDKICFTKRGDWNGYIWRINGGSSYYTCYRYQNGVATQLGSAWNPSVGAVAWQYPINMSIKAVPDAEGPGTWWEFWYEGNGKEPNDPNYIAPERFGTDENNTFDGQDLPYFGVMWGCYDATNSGKVCFLVAPVDKLTASDVVPIIRDPNAFDDDFTEDTTANYQAGLYYNNPAGRDRLATFDWDSLMNISCVSVDTEQKATFLNTEYVREPGSIVSLVTAAPLSAFGSWKIAGLTITDKLFDDDLEGTHANFNGYVFVQNGDVSYFTIVRFVDGVRTVLKNINPTGLESLRWWQGHFEMFIEPNGTSFDFRVMCGGMRCLEMSPPMPNPDGQILFTDNSGILDEADLKYFGMIVGTSGTQEWNPINFDRLKVSQVSPKPAECGYYGYLDGDLDEDCYVDNNDLLLFVDNWLEAAFGDNVPEANPLIYAPEISAITVDGDLSDWDEASSWAEFGTWFNGGLASSSKAQYAWNDAADMLYIGIESTEGEALILEIGGLMGDLSDILTTPSTGIQATQVSFIGWSGGAPGVIMNQADGITDGISAAYTLDGGTMTIEIAMPVYSNWKDANTVMDLATRMDIYDYSNIADAGFTAADSQIADGTYVYLYGSPVIGNASLIRLLEGTAPAGPNDVPDAPGFFGDPDYNRDSIVNFTDFATFAADWLDCTDPAAPCNYVP
ncbi:MAG: hypothetical protein ABIG61_03270 [Planctomycetota bacterium]